MLYKHFARNLRLDIPNPFNHNIDKLYILYMSCTRVKRISVMVLWHFGHFRHWARKKVQCNISRYNFGKLQPIFINAVTVISIILAFIFVLFRRKNKEYTPVMLERERKTSEIWKQNHTRASGGVQKLDSVAWETESVISENSGFKIRQDSKRSSFLVLHKNFFITNICLSVWKYPPFVHKQAKTSCTWHCC